VTLLVTVCVSAPRAPPPPEMPGAARRMLVFGSTPGTANRDDPNNCGANFGSRLTSIPRVATWLPQAPAVAAGGVVLRSGAGPLLLRFSWSGMTRIPVAHTRQGVEAALHRRCQNSHVCTRWHAMPCGALPRELPYRARLGRRPKAWTCPFPPRGERVSSRPATTELSPWRLLDDPVQVVQVPAAESGGVVPPGGCTVEAVDAGEDVVVAGRHGGRGKRRGRLR